MNIDNNQSKILNLEIKSSAVKSFSSLKSLVFFLFLIFLFGLNDAFENNKKVSIECNKSKNICIVKENKYIFGEKQTKVPFDFLGDAYTVFAGSSKGIRYYNLIIPSQYKNLQLYTQMENKNYLDWFVENFNKAKNNAKINDFNILPDTQIYPSIGVVCTPFLFLILIFLIFFVGEKETIITDKVKNEIKIILHRVIWQKTKKISISEIKNLNYKQGSSGTTSSIEYNLINGKKRRLLYLGYIDENLQPIYNKLDEFLSNQIKENELQQNKTLLIE